jgi:hypothetical protein
LKAGLMTKGREYLVNEANAKLKWIHSYVDKDGDIGFNMYLTDEYQRRSFGLAIDRFNTLIDEALKIAVPSE